MKRVDLYISFIAVLFCLMSCASKRTNVVTERYPNKTLKTYQKVATYQVCKQNCRIVKTKKNRIEYYENGKVMSHEKSVNELSLDGNYQSLKINSKYYDENGKLSKRVKKDDLEGKVFVYENGKLKSKKSFDQ